MVKLIIKQLPGNCSKSSPAEAGSGAFPLRLFIQNKFLKHDKGYAGHGRRRQDRFVINPLNLQV